MRSAALSIIAGLFVAGCAGHSIDCMTGNTTKNCAPDTVGHQQMVQEKEADDTVSSIDDARCRSYAGSDSKEYLDCRRRSATVRSPVPAR